MKGVLNNQDRGEDKRLGRRETETLVGNAVMLNQEKTNKKIAGRRSRGR